MSEPEGFEKIEAIIRGADPEMPLRLYINQRTPIDRAGEPGPMDIPRDGEDIQPQIIRHLVLSGCVSGTFSLKVRGPRQKHLGSADVRVVLPVPELPPVPSQIPSVEGGATPGRVPNPSLPVSDEVTRALLADMQAKFVEDMRARLADDDDEEEEEEEEGDDEEGDDEEEAEPPGLVAGMMDDEMKGLLKMGLGRLINNVNEYIEAKVEKAKGGGQSGGAQATVTRIRVVESEPATGTEPKRG